METTKWQLFGLLATKANTLAILTDSSGKQRSGIVQSVEREDGSGQSFNVRLYERIDGNNFVNTIHIRTID